MTFDWIYGLSLCVVFGAAFRFRKRRTFSSAFLILGILSSLLIFQSVFLHLAWYNSVLIAISILTQYVLIVLCLIIIKRMKKRDEKYRINMNKTISETASKFMTYFRQHRASKELEVLKKIEDLAPKDSPPSTLSKEANHSPEDERLESDLWHALCLCVFHVSIFYTRYLIESFFR